MRSEELEVKELAPESHNEGIESQAFKPEDNRTE